MTPYIEREIRRIVAQALKTMPVVVITGMRQTGKTTFLRNDRLFRKYQYITLDDYATLQSAMAQPELLIESGRRLVIDEAQKAPALMMAIKRVVDRNRGPGRFVLSGSANFALLKGMSETLAGRALYLTLHPFSKRETRRSIDAQPFLVRVLTGKPMKPFQTGSTIDPDEILRGGMPSVTSLRKPDASLWFRGFEQTYVERDIRDLARIEDVIGFRNLIKLASLRSGQILNMSQLARDSRLSVLTATRYLQLAEISFLFKRLSPFLRNRSSRLIKSPKLYVADSGLACHLAGVESLGIADQEPMRGVLFETYVLQNISAILDAHLPGSSVTYWHVQGRHEVDFVIQHGNKCIAIELKASTRWSDSDLTSLRIFSAKTPSCKASVLAYNGTQIARVGPGLWVVPMGILLG